MMHLLAWGYQGEFVFATRGEVTPASIRLDPDPNHYSPVGQPVCPYPKHGYKHNPDKEHFTLPTVEEIGLARLNEGKSCVGAMSMVPPNPGAVTGTANWHDENLGTAFGSSGSGSSTAPTTPEGEAKAEALIRKYVEDYPNSFFYTHSPTDRHPDHSALGKAMRKLKGNPVYNGNGSFTFTGGDPELAPVLVNAQFFVSKLYWSVPAGQPGSRMGEYCQWYPGLYGQTLPAFPRRTEYKNFLANQVAQNYLGWNPAQGSFAIGGGHSTYAQMWDCILDPDVTLSALWHP